MLRLIYTSQVSESITPDDIEHIISAARDYNSELQFQVCSCKIFITSFKC